MSITLPNDPEGKQFIMSHQRKAAEATARANAIKQGDRVKIKEGAGVVTEIYTHREYGRIARVRLDGTDRIIKRACTSCTPEAGAGRGNVSRVQRDDRVGGDGVGGEDASRDQSPKDRGPKPAKRKGNARRGA